MKNQHSAFVIKRKCLCAKRSMSRLIIVVDRGTKGVWGIETPQQEKYPNMKVYYNIIIKSKATP